MKISLHTFNLSASGEIPDLSRDPKQAKDRAAERFLTENVNPNRFHSDQFKKHKPDYARKRPVNPSMSVVEYEIPNDPMEFQKALHRMMGYTSMPDSSEASQV